MKDDANALSSHSFFFGSSQSPCPCCFFARPNVFLPEQSGPTAVYPKEPKDERTHQLALSSKSDLIGAMSIIFMDEKGETSSAASKCFKIVDTHGHPHLNRDRIQEYEAQITSGDDSFLKNGTTMSITCAVEEADWKDALGYASISPYILPALGVHPWYLHNVTSDWLERLESLLLQHPRALVGEIGLCKMARNLRIEENKEFALQRQRKAFSDQMRLAAKLRRPVTVHCVKQHRVLLDILGETRHRAIEEFQQHRIHDVNSEEKTVVEDQDESYYIKQALPPTIAMHSFTGSSQHVRELLLFEQSLTTPSVKTRKKKNPNKVRNSNGIKDGSTQKVPNETISTDTSASALIYFGFSHSINVRMCSSEKSKRQLYEAIQSIPTNRILVESDVHAPLDVMIGTVGAIDLVAEALQLPLIEVARLTTKNAMEFLSSILYLKS
jgi:Tat protein secretion system quality control protein TatD with DNase activity